MVCFKYVNNMSKKSVSEYDSDSATISGSSCSSTAKSVTSSTHSSYQYSSTNYDSSSLRSSCIFLSARKENEEQTLEACPDHAEADILSDEDDILDKTLLEKITFDQGYINRRFYTAPLYGSKLLSSIPSALHIIDEKDEYSTSDHSVHTSELTSKRSGKYAFYSDDDELERKITPRQIEVPPKKICIRKASPKKPYKGFNFNQKSIQLCCAASPCESTDDSCRVEDISEAFAAKQTERTKKIKIKEERDVQSSSLPHSVSENSHSETVALEPNIVILDDESSSSKSSLSSKGDAPNDHEIGLMNCCQPKSFQSRPSKSIFSALERYFKSSCEVSPYSPSPHILTTRISSSPQNRASSSSHSSDSDSNRKFTSSATTNLQPRRKEPDYQHNFSTTFDMKSFKEILGNYSEGVKSTRGFPLDFQDLEEEEQKEITFKEKGSQLICTVLNENDYSNSEGQTLNPGQVSRRSLKSQLLVDTRRKQSTDVDFYYSNCSSSSSEQSKEDSTPITDVEEIKVDSEYESRCCLCFRFLRLK